MILLDTSNKLQAVLAGAVATSNPYAVCGYVDLSGHTPGATITDLNGTTDVDLAAAPASGVRAVKSVFVYNRDTAAVTVTIKADASGTDRTLFKATLQAGEQLSYVDGSGWSVYDAAGRQKVTELTATQGTAVLLPRTNGTANLTTTKTITSGSSFAVYMGKAPRSLTSVQIRLRVTTAMATITWGEVALAKGSVNVGGNPTLTVVGYADVSATYNSTGQKKTTINVSSGQAVNEGDDLWVLIGNSATTALVVRGLSIADDIQAGVQASAASRPSTIVGTPTAFTIEGATTVPAWVALII